MDPKSWNGSVELSIKKEVERQLYEHLDKGDIYLRRRPISGTYKNSVPSMKTILELRVDVDGHRPQERISGDVFKRRGFKLVKESLLTPAAGLNVIQNAELLDGIFERVWFYDSFEYSFVVNDVNWINDGNTAVLTGPIVYYDDPGNADESIEVRIPHVSIYSAPQNAAVRIFKAGKQISTYCLPKISKYFRFVDLEIDRFQGTTFPPTLDPDVDPSPSDLPKDDVSVKSVFADAGIDLTVQEDDVLNDADSADPGSNWSEAELHDLMEDRFDNFADRLQWKTYGVVVPRFGDPAYDSGYYGTMFDWGGWQAGDTFFRQGAAIAEDAIRARTSGNLYDTVEKENRILLQTFVHEVGHSFNLPHSWSRSVAGDSASESFMNYPWNYTGGTGGESQFWSNFRWQFDDVELIWMRHQNRIDVIFGGNDWIGNNLSLFIEPQGQIKNPPLKFEIRADPIVNLAEPLRVNLRLLNISSMPQLVVDRLDPEDHLVTLYIKRPGGDFVRYVPPIRRLKAPGNLIILKPGEAIETSSLLSYGAKGIQFENPGEYRIRGFYGDVEDAYVVSNPFRLRIATPSCRSDEELAYLLFDRDVAKFLYFNGSRRYPKVIDDLETAIHRYKDSNPSTIRHLQAAIGIHMARQYKKVKEKRGKKVVTASPPNVDKAIGYFESALEPLPESGRVVFDSARFTELGVRLIECQLAVGNTKDAKATLHRIRTDSTPYPGTREHLRILEKEIGGKSSKRKGTKSKKKK